MNMRLNLLQPALAERAASFQELGAPGPEIPPGPFLDALRGGRLGGAGIDVLPEEPPAPGNALLDARLPNLIVTPHIAWAARESRQRALDEVVANVRDFLSGGHRNRVA